MNTIFIQRGSAQDARRVIGRLVEVLNHESICIFPEGTSTAGDEVLTFKSNLFEAAVLAAVPVCPIAIQYVHALTEEINFAPAYIGDVTLLQSMVNVIRSRHLVVKIAFLPAISQLEAVSFGRKQLASISREAIVSALKY